MKNLTASHVFNMGGADRVIRSVAFTSIEQDPRLTMYIIFCALRLITQRAFDGTSPLGRKKTKSSKLVSRWRVSAGRTRLQSCAPSFPAGRSRVSIIIYSSQHDNNYTVL